MNDAMHDEVMQFDDEAMQFDDEAMRWTMRRCYGAM